MDALSSDPNGENHKISHSLDSMQNFQKQKSSPQEYYFTPLYLSMG